MNTEMYISEKAKKTADACRFCWMCRHICPIGNATGHERNTARARALSISLASRGAVEFDGGIVENLYECALCGGCTSDCVTGFDPVLFTRETRLAAALEGKLPEYITPIIRDIVEKGSPYGDIAPDSKLEEKKAAHKDGKTLLLLGADAVLSPDEAVKAISLVEKAGVSFALLQNEPLTGAELFFLVGDADETRKQAESCADILRGYEKVVVLSPADEKFIKRDYTRYGISTPEIEGYISFTAGLFADGKLETANSGKRIALQDDFNLSRELDETESARSLVREAGQLTEMLNHGKQTFFAGNPLMARYMPDVIAAVASARLHNAGTAGAEILAVESIGEYLMLKKAESAVKVETLWELL